MKRCLLVLLCSLMIILPAYAGTRTGTAPGIYVQEEDGAPAKRFRRIKVPNTTATDNDDGSVSLNFGVLAETDPIASAVNGILKSDGTTLSAATAGTDYYLLGETSSTAYRGDRGKTAYDHSQDNTQAHSDYLVNNAGDVMSATTPYLTLHNTTHEDTDYGREGELRFKGEQTGGEETTLGIIQVGHDGTADDQKGIMSFKVNDGNDGDSLAAKMTIQANGNVGIGTTEPGYKLDLTSSAEEVFRAVSTKSGDAWTKVFTLQAPNIVNGENVQMSFGHEFSNGEMAEFAFRKSATGNYLTLGTYANPSLLALYHSGKAIFNAGNVGIGTTSPATRLEVNGNLTMGNHLYVGDYGTIVSGLNGDSEQSISLTSTQSVDITGANNGYFNVYNDDAWQFYVKLENGDITTKGNLRLYGNGEIGTNTDEDLMQLSDNQLIISGNVGIGTTSPDVNLDIEGNTGLSIGKDSAGGTSNWEGRLKMHSDGDNAFSTTIITGTQTQNVTYTLPLNDGDAGQRLQTDGNGNLTWVTP